MAIIANHPSQVTNQARDLIEALVPTTLPIHWICTFVIIALNMYKDCASIQSCIAEGKAQKQKMRRGWGGVSGRQPPQKWLKLDMETRILT